MDLLTSSGMSPDCSSSGSESSVTTPTTPTSSSPDYLAQLLKDRKQMQGFSNVFIHLGRILEDGEYNLHIQGVWLYILHIDRFDRQSEDTRCGILKLKSCIQAFIFKRKSKR